MFCSFCSFKYSLRNNSAISICLFLLGFSDNVKHLRDILFFSVLSFCFDLHTHKVHTHEFYFLGLNLRRIAGIFENGLFFFLQL